MKQNPSRLKFKKYHKVGSSFLHLLDQKTFMPSFGFFGLKSLEAGKLTFKQLESARRTIRRTTKKDGKIWINTFTSFSVTKKPNGTRMGKGKGAHAFWVCPVRKGQILYELSGLSQDICFKALNNAGNKLPIKTCIVNLTY